MNVDALLVAVPPLAVYLVVGLVVGLESMGIPLPGEVVLVSAALLSSRQELNVSPQGVALAAAAGAVIGDSVGFAVGRRFGDRLFAFLGRRFPRHADDAHVAWAEHVFTRYGVVAVFFGRFIALLRIFAGPLAGALRMPYRRFLAANVLGALVWAGGTTFLDLLPGHARRAVAAALRLGGAGRGGGRRRAALAPHAPPHRAGRRGARRRAGRGDAPARARGRPTDGGVGRVPARPASLHSFCGPAGQRGAACSRATALRRSAASRAPGGVSPGLHPGPPTTASTGGRERGSPARSAAGPSAR